MIMCILDKYFEKKKGFYPFFKYCPKKYQKHYINKRASLTLGYEYDYTNLRTLNEKIRWLIYNEKPNIKSILTDKIKVKTYIITLTGEGHAAETFGIWDSFDDIDFSYLPNEFALKANHGWKMNILVKNKKFIKEHKKEIRKRTNDWLKIKYAQYSLEPQYEDIEPKLFAEYLRPLDTIRQDYQVHCFNGIPIMVELADKESHKAGIIASRFYDTDWNLLPYSAHGKLLSEKADEKLDFLEEMLGYSRILSKNFSYVRIDIAKSIEHLHILEMTFTPCFAMIPFNDKTHDFELGRLLKLPSENRTQTAA